MKRVLLSKIFKLAGSLKTLFIMLVFVMGVLISGGLGIVIEPGYAISRSDLNAIINNHPFYNPERVDCGPGNANSVDGLPGAEALKAQEANGLDPLWVELILKVAAEKGVDPIVMAGLLYVENSGFPEYKTSGWSVDSSRGSGPWQIIGSVWPSAAGSYTTNVQDPVTATPVAAELVKGNGGVAGITMGSIRDDFSKDNQRNLKTVAAVGKNYNAGIGTWREPGVAGYKQDGRSWTKPGGAWGGTKQTIIDHYIVIFQYVYYHIATGKPVPAHADNNVRADAAVAMIDTIESFKPSGGSSLPTNTDTANTPTPEPATPDPSATTSGSEKAVIALDPGHGAAIADAADPVTGLIDRETSNSPERENVQVVAERVKATLETAGYTVVLLKTGAADSVSKRERVDRAIAAKANLVVSIHTTPGEINEAWPQRVGKFRENDNGTSRTTFSNAATAALSEKYAKAIAEERTVSEGHSVDTDPDQSTQIGAFGKGRDGLPTWGDISLVQLWSPDIPWVYNEIGQNSGTAITDDLIQKYADGIANGIKKSLPTTGTPGTSTAAGCDGENPIGGGGVEGLISTIKAYAWPDYHKKPYLERKPEYIEAVDKAKAAKPRQYIGDTCHGGGIDCGGFVTRAVVDSGYDPRYNYDGTQNGPNRAGPGKKSGSGTSVQQTWAEDNWEALGPIRDTAQLRPGDVAFQPGHTFIYVGEVPGFNGVWASASRCSRAPMAGQGGEWTNTIFFRKKG